MLLGDATKVLNGGLKTINDGAFPCLSKSHPFATTVCDISIADALPT